MWAEPIITKLSDNQSYNRDDLFHIFNKEKKSLSESTFRWMLYNLQKEQLLFRTDYDTYTTVEPQSLPVYRPVYTDKAKSVIRDIGQKYPSLSFVVFESVLLNEFLNHQIAQNTIYIQVEKDVSSYIFDSLQQERPGSILYKPNAKDFERYWTPNCTVILDLISQSPLSAEYPHEITIEKMLVDILADKSIAATFSPAELPYIFEDVMESYQADKRRMNRYASRRAKTKEIKKYTGGTP